MNPPAAVTARRMQPFAATSRPAPVLLSHDIVEGHRVAAADPPRAVAQGERPAPGQDPAGERLTSAVVTAAGVRRGLDQRRIDAALDRHRDRAPARAAAMTR